MVNEIARAGDNPWLAYGNAAAARTIVGDLLKFSKGDFTAGTHDDEIPLGTRLVAIMPSLTIGWIKWLGNRPVEQRMGAVAENFQPATRRELGDEDQGEWETPDGEPRDPWQFSNYLILVSQDEPARTFTFTTSSRGGLGAIGELSKTYGKALRQHPGQCPVIELDVGSYLHSNRAYGRIKFPIFKVVDWVAEAPFTKLLTGAEGGSSDGDDSGDDDVAATF
jgi:hypothetical protein